MLHGGALRRRQIHLSGHVAVGGTQHRGDTRSVKAILQIVLQQLVGGRDRHRAQLVQTQHSKPELVVPLEDQHHAIAFLNAQGLKVVGALVGGLFHILKGETALGMVTGYVEHRQFLRLLVRQGVHQIKSKVKMLGILEGNGGGGAVFVFHHIHKLLIDTAAVVPLIRRQIHDGLGGGQFGDRLAGGIQHDGVEHAVLTAHSDHTVRSLGIEIDAVTGTQHLAVFADLHHQLTLQHQIQLLTVVGGQLNILLLGGGIVHTADIQRLGNTILESVGQVIVGHTVCLGDLLSLPPPGDGKGLQLGAVTLDDVGDIHIQCLSTTVDKGEIQVALTCLTAVVFLYGHTGLIRHHSGGQPLDLPQFADTGGHFLNFIIQCGDGFHTILLSGSGCKRKTLVPK